MKGEKVSATIRYSQDTGKGAWKVIELGAEGSVEPRETWQSAQAYLYHELGSQLRTLWTNGTNNGQHDAETAIAGPAEPEPGQTTREHWCEEHQTAFTQKSGKDGQAWYSHKADGQWCREAA